MFLWGGCAQQDSRAITTGIPSLDIQTRYPFLFLEDLDPDQRFQKINDHFAYGCEENLRLINYVQKHHVTGDLGNTIPRLKEAMSNIVEEGRLPTPYFKENSENKAIKTIEVKKEGKIERVEIKPPVLIEYVNFIMPSEHLIKTKISQFKRIENFCSIVEEVARHMMVQRYEGEDPSLSKRSLLALLHKSIFRYFVASLDPHSYILESPEQWYMENGLKDRLRRSHLENASPVFASSENPFYDRHIQNGPFWKTEWLSHSVLRIEFTLFDDGTAATFEREYQQHVNEKSISALVIDLRRNRGGSSLVVAHLADLFLKEGEMLLLRERVGEGWTMIRNQKGGPFYAQSGNELAGIEALPVIILVSRYSSSSAETFAAAMQDHEAAIVIGEKTQGKGTGQRTPLLRQLPLGIDSSARLMLTTLYTYSPKGIPIQLSGIDPDIGVEDQDYVSHLMTSEDREEYDYHREADQWPHALPVPEPLATGFEPHPHERMSQWKEKLTKYFESHQNLFSLASLADAF